MARPVRLIRFLFLAALLIGATVSADDYRSDVSNNVFRFPSSNTAGLLDPAKLHLSNSVSFMYTTGSRYEGMGGLYQNRLHYQLTRPLSVTVLLGYEINRSVGSERFGPEESTRFLPGFALNYQPNEKFHVRLEYRHMPSMYNADRMNRSYSLYNPYDSFFW